MSQTRTEKLLHSIDPAHQVGIEIGPLHNPVVTRDMGQVYYVDHTTTAALRAKYGDDPNVDVSTIVEVDYVWGEKSLSELLQSHAPVDYVIASHVIEHVPDFIGWLEEIRSVLKPGGILSLAVPDRRQCFDYKRQPTELAEVFEAYLYRSRRPTPRQVFAAQAAAVHIQGQCGWSGEVDDADLTHYFSLAEARDYAKAAFETDKYLDVHCWVFTPVSFFRLLEALASLGLLSFEVAQFHPTVINEFLVSLRAVDNPHYPSVIQPEPEVDLISALRQLKDAAKVQQDLQTQLQTAQQQTETERAAKVHLQECIRAMESSKFWQIRSVWIKLRRTLVRVINLSR